MSKKTKMWLWIGVGAIVLYYLWSRGGSTQTTNDDGSTSTSSGGGFSFQQLGQAFGIG